MFQGKSKSFSRSAKFQIEAFVDSEDASNAAEKLAGQLGDAASLTVHAGTLATAARLIGAAPLGDVLIAELGSSLETDLDRIKELSEAGSRVIVVGHRSDIPAFREILSAGGQEYFPLPLQDGDRIKLGLLDPSAAASPSKAGARSIAVCGVSGGLGASAIAQNLAVAYIDAGRSGKLPRDAQGRAALLDADLEFGSVAADLNVDPTFGFFDALQVPERVDEIFLTSTMAMPLEGLCLYSASVNDPASIKSMENGFPRLMRRCRHVFPTTIIDLPRGLLAGNPELADELDEIIFVLGPGFSSVRNCSRLVERIGKVSSNPRVSYLMSNRRRHAGLKPSEVKQALSIKSLHELPESAADLERASVKGQPLQRISRKGAYSRAIAGLVSTLEVPETATAKPKRKGLFSRKAQQA